MTNETNRGWRRWLLAVVDGAFFGWLLFIAWHAALNLIQISEWVWSSRPENLQPPLTIWVNFILPDEAWSMVSGILAFSFGFALISLTSNEAPTSRLFRWAVICVLTVLFGLSLPAMAAFKNLSGGPDGHTSDEVLFVALALTVLVYGITRCRRLSHPQA